MSFKLFHSQNRVLTRATTIPTGCAVATNDHPRWSSSSLVYGTNNFRLNLIPNHGTGGGSFGSLVNIGLFIALFLSDEKDSARGTSVFINKDYNNFGISIPYKYEGKIIRCVKDYSGSLHNGSVISNAYTDGDGNTYDATVIGNQLWTTKHLLTTKYQNGTSIPNVTNQTTWNALTTGAYRWYYDDYNAYGQYYGAVYNWYAINNGLVSGDGWRVPSLSDWNQLVSYLTTQYSEITTSNISMYLKSCRQVNHPLG